VETLDATNPKHARADDKLRHEIAAWLTTVTAGGQPQSTPIWFHWDGSTFLIYSQPDRPKLHNIATPRPWMRCHRTSRSTARRSRGSVGRLRAWPPTTPSRSG
jgi:PPOX class probable F420-dependent enzyme